MVGLVFSRGVQYRGVANTCTHVHSYKRTFTHVFAGYWDAKPEQLEKLRQMYTDVEDKIEGVEA